MGFGFSTNLVLYHVKMHHQLAKEKFTRSPPLIHKNKDWDRQFEVVAQGTQRMWTNKLVHNKYNIPLNMDKIFKWMNILVDASGMLLANDNKSQRRYKSKWNKLQVTQRK